MATLTQYLFIAFDRIKLISLLLSTFYLPALVAEEATSDNTELKSPAPKISPKSQLTYYINNQSLVEDIQYDRFVNQSKIENTANGELLILTHLSKTKVKRGNALILHTNGESANHHRIIRPLSIQLSHLGWNVYVPNIAKEDFKKPKFGDERKIYPIKSKSAIQKSNNDAEEKPEQNTQNESSNSNAKAMVAKKVVSDIPLDNQFYFETSDQYQTYIKGICKTIFSIPNWSSQSRILILNQSSGYWGLSCLENGNIPTIFLDPQLPLGTKNNLEEIFSSQSSSFYVFYSQLTANTRMASFSKALSSNTWQSKNQRYSQGILPRGNLDIENVSLAKRITGWTENLRKKR